MGKINKLQPEVFNMIAAGEVVERPASVVKELVENSIDAGSTNIEISIVDGGIKKISVADNGTGIMKDDIALAFAPHATSKIKNFEDIDVLSSLGFRGEALASIASVSEVTLLTCTQNDEALITHVRAGKIESQDYASRTRGTTITVENLFYNTPARLKFLKKTSSEANIIIDVVRKLMLANPSVAISLSIDGKLIFEQPNGSLEDSLYSVYDAKTVQGLFPINSEYNGIRVDGYISKIEFTKPNRTWQTIIINGRCVESQTISTAVEQAYSGFLMKRCYPMFVLDIVMPFDQIDVNVHPRKSEVRFSNQQAIFSAIYHVVSNYITNYAHELAVNLSAPSSSHVENKNESFEQIKIDTSSLYVASSRQKPNYLPKINQDYNESNKLFPSQGPGKNTNSNFSLNPNQQEINFEEYPQNENSNNQENLENVAYFDGEIIGQLFNTYILVEKDDKAYLIDQHAAHERILYEKIKKNIDNGEQQFLLIPYTIYLSGEESDYFMKILPKLTSMGFDIQKESQNKFSFYAIPAILVGIDMKKFMGNIFEDMISDEDLSMEVLVKDKISQQACKAAIKGGNEFTRVQIAQVLSALIDENGNLPARCPHGRPTVVAFSKQDVEKLFKRII